MSATDKFSIAPSLALLYEEAMAEVYDVDRFVPKAQWDKVYAVEQELVRKGMDINHYAKTIARLWHLWCDEKELSCVPLNVFIGPKSIQWYRNYQMFGVDVISPSRMEAIILHDEVTLALLYIGSITKGQPVTMRKLRNTVRTSPEWWSAYEADELPTLKAAEQVCGILGIEYTTSDYNTIAEVVRGRNLHMEQRLS